MMMRYGLDWPPLPGRTFRTKDIIVACGFTRRQLNYWVKSGLVVPSVKAATSSGRDHIYSPRDFTLLICIAALKHLNWSTQKVRAEIAPLVTLLYSAGSANHAILHGSEYGVIFYKSHQDRDAFKSSIQVGGRLRHVVIEKLLEDALRTLTMQPSLPWSDC